MAGAKQRLMKASSNDLKAVPTALPVLGVERDFEESRREWRDSLDALHSRAELTLRNGPCGYQGPSGTPFEGGSFDVTMMIPSQYPLAPPTVKFKTRIFHPNVHFKTGEICLDILKTTWSPAWTLHAVCQAILALMSAPEPDSPLNCDAGNLLRLRDNRGYNSLARMYTIEYAIRR